MPREDLQKSVDAIRWFHRIDLGDVVTPGLDDSPAKLRRVQLPADLSGKTVLDLCAWDGFFSFEAERRHASRVLAVDSFCWHGAGWGTKAGFELARETLRSKVEDRELEVLDVSPDKIGVFDVVLFLGVLYHMHHPLLALEKVASVTGELLILETKVDLLTVPAPALAVYGGKEVNNDPTNYTAPNLAGLCCLLRSVGFKRIEIVSPPQPWPVRLFRVLRGGWREFGRDRVTVHAWK